MRTPEIKTQLTSANFFGELAGDPSRYETTIGDGIE